MLSFFVGAGWGIAFLIMAVVSVVLGFWSWLSAGRKYRSDSPTNHTTQIGAAVVAVFFLGMAFWAFTHFRVEINERALLKNVITQELIGVRGAGVASRPLFGVKVILWPATASHTILLQMDSGLASAPSKETNTPLKTGVTFYVDLRNMDLEQAYLDGFTTWGVFHNNYLLPQAGSNTRSVTQGFNVDEHSTKKDEWASRFDKRLDDFLSDDGRGYGIKIVPGRTVMEWDFVSPDDAAAYDNANRAKFLLIERGNQLEAAEKEREIAKARAGALIATAEQTVDALETILDFVRPLPDTDRAALAGIWGNMVNLEYLRVVQELKPDVIFPPGSGPSTTFDTSGMMGSEPPRIVMPTGPTMSPSPAP